MVIGTSRAPPHRETPLQRITSRIEPVETAVPSVHLLTSLLVRPTLTLRVSDSLSGGGTHLACFRGRWCSRLLGSVTGQQITDLLQACNFGVNRGENLVYRHAESISNCLLPYTLARAARMENCCTAPMNQLFTLSEFLELTADKAKGSEEPPCLLAFFGSAILVSHQELGSSMPTCLTPARWRREMRMWLSESNQAGQPSARRVSCFVFALTLHTAEPA